MRKRAEKWARRGGGVEGSVHDANVYFSFFGVGKHTLSYWFRLRVLLDNLYDGAAAAADAGGGCWLHWFNSTWLTIEHFYFTLSIEVFSTCQRKNDHLSIWKWHRMEFDRSVFMFSIMFVFMLELAVWKSSIYANGAVVVHWALTLYKHGRTHAHFHTMFTVCKARAITRQHQSRWQCQRYGMVSFRFSALFLFLPDRFYRWKLCTGVPPFCCISLSPPPMTRGYQTNAYLSLVSEQTKWSCNKRA